MTGEDECGFGVWTSVEAQERLLVGKGVGAATESEYRFQVIDVEQVLQYMEICIREVRNVLQVSPAVARTLLNFCKWDDEKLMERFYDEREKLFKAAHIGTSVAASEEKTCAICSSDDSDCVMTGLECGHTFCTRCWVEYLTMRIASQGVQMISCAAHGCGMLVDDAFVMNLVKDEKIKSRYLRLTARSFVQANKLLRWCPRKDCARAIRVQYSADAKPVKCECGSVFCFACGYDWHDPVNCTLLRTWIKKCDSDRDTANWLATNTKDCPKCRAVVQKDGGCNHMVCKNVNCGFEYCWLCLGAWQPHGSSFYKCNRYNDSDATEARTEMEKSRAEMRRYLHYCNRYVGHMKSMEFENGLYTGMKKKMTEMQAKGLSWIEVQFLRKAVDVLCQCRRTLMYTYAFAYYVSKNNQALIFEDNQNDLERATEQLSESLERDLEKEKDLVALKQRIVEQLSYCGRRRSALLGHCHEGDEKDWWKFMGAAEPNGINDAAAPNGTDDAN